MVTLLSAGHVVLDAGEQVGVAVGDVGRLVAHAVRDGERGEAHVDEQRHVAVPEVVDADGLEAGRLAPARHLVAEEVLGHGEDPLIGAEVEPGEERLHLLRVEARHGDDALRLRGLRVGEDVPPVDALVGLGHGEGPPLEVEPPRLQGEQLPLAHAAPVERLEGVEGERLVHDLVGEPEVLVLGPEPHLSG